jgi:hypothetical protein
VRLLDDSLSELNRGCFRLSLLFFADGVTLLLFDADANGSCRLLPVDALVVLRLLFLTLNPFSEQIQSGGQCCYFFAIFFGGFPLREFVIFLHCHYEDFAV